MPVVLLSFTSQTVADPLNNAIGRRGAVMVAAISKLTPPRPGLYWPRLVNAPTFPLVLIATPIGMAVTQSWQQFLAVRILFGISIGLKGSTVPVYSAEVAPTVIRGALGQ